MTLKTTTRMACDLPILRTHRSHRSPLGRAFIAGLALVLLGMWVRNRTPRSCDAPADPVALSPALHSRQYSLAGAPFWPA